MMLDVRRAARSSRTWIAAAILVVLSTAPMFGASTPPLAFKEIVITNTLDLPTAMAVAPDGRVFVCLQTGALRVIDNDILLPTPFATLPVDANGERGLLGVAFDPAFTSNHFVYVYYTATTPAIHNRVSRFTANGNVAVPGSEVVLLDLNNLSAATNHNGGAIHFGLDGKLYIAVGENANTGNSQTLTNLLGKVLRINPTPGNIIPTDNPFFNDPNVVGVNKAIWAMGLRNPFTFSVNPVNGQIFINDVGQVEWEEINVGAPGANYGWPICEGNVCGSAPPPNYVAPLYTYHHVNGTPTGCAITGGHFYSPNGVQFPSQYVGKYFFADVCGGFVRYIDPAAPAPIPASTPFSTGVIAAVDLALTSNGALYVLQRGNPVGLLIKYVYPSNPEKTVDFDKDGHADVSVWRQGTGVWYLLNSASAPAGIAWGTAGDKPTPGDYDGDGATDIAVFRPSNGAWYILQSSNGVFAIRFFGQNGDVPMPGDYDGDGKTDPAVFRPSTSTWFIQRSSDGQATIMNWGLSTDTPASGDYDGDGKTDIAIWRPSEGRYYIVPSTTNIPIAANWGANGDRVVPGDYDNDGKIDLAIFRPSTGAWWIQRSSDGGVMSTSFGLPTDTPVPADYDGDGKTDIAVWRSSTGIFWIVRSSNGAVMTSSWGGAAFGDVAVAASYIK